MGYETKLIIGRLSINQNGLKNRDCKYVMVIATINLYNSCFAGTYVDKQQDITKVFIFASDGNTEISQDHYGDQLFAIDPNKILSAMKSANKKEKCKTLNGIMYRAAIPMLESLIKDFNKDGNLVCVLFGH